MDKLIQQVLFECEIKLNEYINHLFEGGAWGHLSHPFEDLDLTFKDLKDIIISSLSGKLQAYEKTDGIQLSFTWKNNQLKVARNKSQLKNYGENALNKNQLKQVFSDRPEHVQQSLQLAFNDLEKALLKVPTETLNEIFQNGKCFMSVEIIFPASQNVIPYGSNLLVFHGTTEFDENGNAIGSGVSNSADILEKVIKSINANVQQTFTIRGPNKLQLNKVKEYSAKKALYLNQLKKLQGNLSDNTKVIQYYIDWWKNFIINKAKQYNYTISDDILNILINHWAKSDKSIPITQIKSLITNPDFAQWVIYFDKNEYTKTYKSLMEPFELLFLKLGIDVLSNASGYLAISPDMASKQIAKRIKAEIDNIKKSNNIQAIEKLKHELNRIKKLGGLKNVSGTEGITFYKNGKIYKLTGLFAPINQLLGIIKFKRYN